MGVAGSFLVCKSVYKLSVSDSLRIKDELKCLLTSDVLQQISFAHNAWINISLFLNIFSVLIIVLENSSITWFSVYSFTWRLILSFINLSLRKVFIFTLEYRKKNLWIQILLWYWFLQDNLKIQLVYILFCSIVTLLGIIKYIPMSNFSSQNLTTCKNHLAFELYPNCYINNNLRNCWGY